MSRLARFMTASSPPRMNSTTPKLKPLDRSSIGWPAPLLDTACAIASRKWIALIIVSCGLAVGTFRLCTLPKQYKASAVAVLLPREKPNLDASIETSSLETSDDRASRSASGNLMLPPDPVLYTTLINSQAVIEQIARKYRERLSEEIPSDARSGEIYQSIRSMIKVTSTEEGLITVTVTSTDPKLSADIANELFEECQKASKSIERQLLLQQARHLQEAAEHANLRMATFEQRLKDFTARHRVINVDMQASNRLRSLRELAVKRDELLGDLEEMRLYYAEAAPEISRVKARIAAIDRQRAEAGETIVGTVGSSGYGALIVEHESLEQRLRIERDLVATLSAKADIYRIRAEEPIGNLATLSPARVPVCHAGPSARKELGVALGFSLALAIGWTLAMDQWCQARRNGYIEGRLSDLRRLTLSTHAWTQRQPVIDLRRKNGGQSHARHP